MSGAVFKNKAHMARKGVNMYQVEYGSNRRKKIIWGILLLLAAAALVVDRMGYLEGISVGTVLFSICLICFFVDGFFRRSFAEILFAAAFFVIVNDEVLGLEKITPWPVLGAALLGSIGLRMLFPKFRKKPKFVAAVRDGKQLDGKTPVFEESWDGSSFSCENAFGESVKYLSGTISHISADNAFGSLKIYFSDAVLHNSAATVDVDNAFGKTVLFVPAGWKVEVAVETFFGSTNEEGRCGPDGANMLTVRGNVIFGQLVVSYA